MAKKHLLPDALRSLVHDVVAEWGDVLREEEGTPFFTRIEALRRRMNGLRDASPAKAERVLADELTRFRGLERSELFKTAHAFAVMMELVNSCENAYRSHRIRVERRTKPEADYDPLKGDREAFFVLTSHPTESRSRALVATFHELQRLFFRRLEAAAGSGERARKRELMRLLWRLSLSPAKKPRVQDEADAICSIALRPEILDLLCSPTALPIKVTLRTWVGGDKDGHPGVDAAVTRDCLSRSRQFLRAYVSTQLESFAATVGRVRDGGIEPWKTNSLGASSLADELRLRLNLLQAPTAGDALKVAAFREAFEKVRTEGERLLGTRDPALERIAGALRSFPALVLPLELRDSAEVFHEALRGTPGSTAIEGMLIALAEMSKGGRTRDYARGLIVSMTETADDLKAALSVMERAFDGHAAMLVVPLFEKESALRAAPHILEEFVQDKRVRAALAGTWDRNLETMLGYSDSAKEIGVLPSRHLIREAVTAIDRLARKYSHAEWIYFHGSGGSIERGGGSLDEQTSWWPSSCLRTYKATIQGEMIARSFSSPEVLSCQIEKIAALEKKRRTPTKFTAPERTAIEAFTGRIAEIYRSTTASPGFLDCVQKATTYRFLDELRIGSRPSKRKAFEGVQSLRAIPWVLSWTQTRVLFPTWWGFGSAWDKAKPVERRALKTLAKKDPLLSSYLKQLGFTFAKIELPVWERYLEASAMDAAAKRQFRDAFRKEHALAVTAWRTLTGQKDFLWFRPWLGESVRLRAPWIHPLNLAQIIAMADEDHELFAECVVGIACGMMTTG